MNPREQGFLLLCSHLGDPERRCLTTAQFRTLAWRAGTMEKPLDDRSLTDSDLQGLGYDEAFAQRVVQLLSGQEQLSWYLQKGRKSGCFPITRLSESYPKLLRSRLGLDAPGCLWAKGDVSILEKPMVALVGSRDMAPENEAFAKEVGAQAARQGYTLLSGNARGADRAAQESCLLSGGRVVSVVADALENHRPRKNVLYICEDGFDIGFSALRALSRNRVIHAMGEKVFVAQCGLHTGGTWDGTAKNLAKSWSPVFCFADGSEAVRELTRMGAVPLRQEVLADLAGLQSGIMNFIDQ